MTVCDVEGCKTIVWVLDGEGVAREYALELLGTAEHHDHIPSGRSFNQFEVNLPGGYYKRVGDSLVRVSFGCRRAKAVEPPIALPSRLK
jgi:hypothetical protein